MADRAKCINCALFPWMSGADLDSLPAAKCHESLPMRRFTAGESHAERDCEQFQAKEGQEGIENAAADNVTGGADLNPEAVELASKSAADVIEALVEITDVEFLKQVLEIEEAKGEKARKTVRQGINERLALLTPPPAPEGDETGSEQTPDGGDAADGDQTPAGDQTPDGDQEQ